MMKSRILAITAALAMSAVASQALASDVITTRFSNATNQAAKDAAVAMQA